MKRLLIALAVVALAATPSAATASPPQIDYTLSGQAGDGGWYVGPVTITWWVTPNATSASCPAVQSVPDDTTGTTRTCTASNADGTVQVTTKIIRIDKAPPTNVTAAPARPPDVPPFYTAPVPITWSATDATSGIASCVTTTYAGPDSPSVQPQGTCRDRAGNVSPPVGLTFAYDATAPPLAALTATAAPNRTIALAWSTTPDAQSVSVVRQPGSVAVLDQAPAATRAVTDGPLPAAVTYTYAVTVRDAAGHATTASASATTPAPTSAAAARADKRPTLRWRARRGASYYNLQLFRNGRKILSTWPTTNHYTLKSSWRYRGRTRKLTPGRYRWYVWPGYGARAAHRYGRLVTKGAVTVPGQR
ncbi:MAG TPA: hypothetical protein VNT03_22590 [Baekduia sp.]|nr:hypothetical protein [Baekduia sp.]